MIEIKHRHTGKRLLRLRLESLVSADLQGADLRHADLAHQILTGANLNSASLVDADLLYASLAKADLTDAVLTGALVAGAELVGARLVGTDLSRANLTKANLAGADLERARLTGAVLKDTRFDDHTRWPADFVPEQYGAIRLEKTLPLSVYPEYQIRLAAVPSGEGAVDRPIDAGQSKLGGLPDWMHYDERPGCPGCDRAMVFVGQIDSIGCVNPREDPLDFGDYIFSDCGMIYVFFCPDCSEVQAVLQFH